MELDHISSTAAGQHQHTTVFCGLAALTEGL